MDQDRLNPSVAILILNFNQWLITLNCVESVLRSDYCNFKIFLIDNGSFSGHDYDQLKSLESDNCSVIRIEKNKGYAGGMNYGLEISSKENFDFFLIMNNDTVIAPDAVSSLVACSLKHNNNCIVTGKVYHFDQPGTIQHIGYRFTNKKYLKMKRLIIDQPDIGQWDKEMEMDMIDDIFWLLPAVIYKKIGGYSAYFWFNAEQADLALRATNAGFRLIYTPLARLWHKGSVTIGGRFDNPKLTFYDTQGSLIFYYLHLPFFRFIIVLFRYLFRIITGLLKGLVKRITGKKGKLILVYADFLAVLWVLIWLIRKSENNGLTPFDNKSN